MKAIFFDLDDTIYDRAIPFQRTYDHFFPEDPVLSRKAYNTCRIRGVECFEDSQTGKITLDEMFIYRYTKGFQDVGVTLSPEQALEFQHVYEGYQNRLELTNRMRTLLDYSRRHFDRVGIISNGPGQHQRDKIDCLGIQRWLDPELIFISQECDSIKPDEKIFRMAEAAVGLTGSDIVYVGDSYSSDMATPIRLGWKTIWLNRERVELQDNQTEPDYVVETEEGIWLSLRDMFGR